MFTAVGGEKQIHPVILPRLLEKGHGSRGTSSAEKLIKSVLAPLNFACGHLCAFYRQPMPVHIAHLFISPLIALGETNTKFTLKDQGAHFTKQLFVFLSDV
jgi:hypothetical protein